MARREEQVRLTEADRTSQLQAAFLNMLVPQDPAEDIRRPKRQKHKGGMKEETVSHDHPCEQNVNRLCHLMARILIHEDSIQSIHTQDSFLLYFNKGNQGIVPTLLQAGKDWKEESAPTKPLRACLMQTVMEQMMMRYTSFCNKLSDESFLKASQDSFLCCRTGCFPT